MKLLLCEGSDAEALLTIARDLPYPYRLWRGEAGYLLVLEAAPQEVAAELATRLEAEVGVYELVEEGCGSYDDA